MKGKNLRIVYCEQSEVAPFRNHDFRNCNRFYSNTGDIAAPPCELAPMSRLESPHKADNAASETIAMDSSAIVYPVDQCLPDRLEGRFAAPPEIDAWPI